MQATGSWSTVVKSAAVSALKGLCAGYCFIKYVASLGQVRISRNIVSIYKYFQAEGPSMYPTISGDTLLIDKWTSSKRYRVGDVVTAWSPETRNYMVCKRIKGNGNKFVSYSLTKIKVCLVISSSPCLL